MILIRWLFDFLEEEIMAWILWDREIWYLPVLNTFLAIGLGSYFVLLYKGPVSLSISLILVAIATGVLSNKDTSEVRLEGRIWMAAYIIRAASFGTFVGLLVHLIKSYVLGG